MIRAGRSAPLALAAALAACTAGAGGAPDAGPRCGPPSADAAASDARVPATMFVTVNDIPAAMNGSAPFTANDGKKRAFRLAVPESGFTLDVHFKGSGVRPASLVVTADAPLGATPAGENLAPRFCRTAAGASYLVPASAALAPGRVTFTARLTAAGKSLTSRLTVDVVKKTFMLDPFRLQDTWLLVYSQDLYAIRRGSSPRAKWLVTATKGRNGVADFVEDLRAAGLSTARPHAAARRARRFGVTGPEAIMAAWMRREILAGVRRAFGRAPDGSARPGAVRIRFYNEGDPGAPRLADFRRQVLRGGETKKRFSAISIGGGDLTTTFLGRSRTVDLRNVENEDNVGPKYGVFTTTALAMLSFTASNDPLADRLLASMLGPFVPELGQKGVPVGESPLDGEILAEGFDPAKASAAARKRHAALKQVVTVMGRLVGALTAHEIGHALGLVAGGPPPTGLFGGERRAEFVNGARTTASHIDTPGFNIMAAGPGSARGTPVAFAEFLTDPKFNALNMAYLRGRVLLLPKK